MEPNNIHFSKSPEERQLHPGPGFKRHLSSNDTQVFISSPEFSLRLLDLRV